MSDATDMLARIEAQPLRLSDGRDLQDWLGHETALGPERAAILIREYRRFLALAATAEPGAPAMPSPMVQVIWRFHRDDTAAYEAFRDALAAPRLNHRLSRWQVSRAESYKATRSRYRAAFGALPLRWWPAPWVVRMRPALEILLLVGCWSVLVMVDADRLPAGVANFWFSGGLTAFLLANHFAPMRIRSYEGARGSLAMPPDER